MDQDKRAQHITPVCPTPEDDPVREFVQRAGYKLCPSCGNAIKRMYGCASMKCIYGKKMCWGCGKSVDQCDDSVECEVADDEGLGVSEDYYSNDSTDEDALDEEDTNDDDEEADADSRPGDAELAGQEISKHQHGEAPNRNSDEAQPLPQQQQQQQLLNTTSDRQAPGSEDERPQQTPGKAFSQARASQSSEKDAAQAIAESDRRDAQDSYFGEEPDGSEHNFLPCDHKLISYVDRAGKAGLTRNNLLECHRCWARVRATSPDDIAQREQSKLKSPTHQVSNKPPHGKGKETPSAYDNRLEAYLCLLCGVIIL